MGALLFSPKSWATDSPFPLITWPSPHTWQSVQNATFWHRLFWSGNRGAVKYDRRKQSLRECALQARNGERESVRQVTDWNSLVVAQNRGKQTGRQGSVWEVSPWIPTDRSGNSLRLWLVCVRCKACGMTAQGLKEQASCRYCKDNIAFNHWWNERRGSIIIPPRAHDFHSLKAGVWKNQYVISEQTLWMSNVWNVICFSMLVYKCSNRSVIVFCPKTYRNATQTHLQSYDCFLHNISLRQ